MATNVRTQYITNIRTQYYSLSFNNNNYNNKVHYYLTSTIFQSIESKLKSLSIEALEGRRLSTSPKGLLKQAGI